MAGGALAAYWYIREPVTTAATEKTTGPKDKETPWLGKPNQWNPSLSLVQMSELQGNEGY